MCGRFELDASPRQVARQFGLPDTPVLPNLSEICPTDMALIITPSRQTELLSWGIPAPWNNKPIFNARSETLLEKPVFSSYLANRCVVPATAFPEWLKDGKQRIKHRISLTSGDVNDETPESSIMAFAGLYDETHFTIITCPACDRMATVHSRMPVILPQESISMWLDQEHDSTSAVDVLIPYSGDDLVVTEDPPTRTQQQTRQADLFS